MAIEMSEPAEGRILEVRATGKLTHQDYQSFVPEAERLIRLHGKVSVLFDMEGFHGWAPGALWDDIKFDVKHFADIERIAMVGDAKWQKGMSEFCKIFTTAKIRYFDHSQMDEARSWLKAHESSPALKS